MNGIKAKETIYKGYRFRSRLEARWAVFFDALGIGYEYEPEGLVLKDGESYLPDFYLPYFNCYFEVKRLGLIGTRDGKEALRKISYGAWTDTWAGLIAFGDPVDDRMVLYCQESDDGGGGSYENRVTFGRDPDTGKLTLYAPDDRRDRVFYPYLGGNEEMDTIPCITREYGRYKPEDVRSASIERARIKARQARFEHGEHP